MSGLRKRLEMLEGRVQNNSIVLNMPDGEKLQIAGDALKLLAAAIGGTGTPKQRRQLALIARSESSVESDGAQLIDLARSVLNSPDPNAAGRILDVLLRITEAQEFETTKEN